jgi:soluble lytic murein transglycosylase-like protein
MQRFAALAGLCTRAVSRRLRPRRLRSALTVAALVATIAGAQAATGPSTSGSTYRVARGETLSHLARRFHVSVAALAGANGIADPDRILAGTRLAVPRPSPSGVARGGPASAPGRLPARLRQQPQRLALIPRFDAEARRYGVPADLLKALTWLESGWQNDKVSSTKALGIGQLMPDTVAFLNTRLLPTRLDPRRPEHNIRMSARFLAYLLQQSGGDVRTAVASYYQGLGSVRRIGLIPDSRRYVDQVLGLRAKF